MNEDQIMLRDALIGRLASHDGESAWVELGNAGVRGLCVPEELGGLGFDAGRRCACDGGVGRTLLADVVPRNVNHRNQAASICTLC